MGNMLRPTMLRYVAIVWPRLNNINFISLQVVPAAGVANSYANFLATVVLKIHFNNFIDKCSFPMSQFFSKY